MPERVVADTEGRLDVILARQLGVTRSFAQKMIRDGAVAVPDLRSRARKTLKPSVHATAGDAFDVTVPPPETLDLEPEEVPFDVVYEDAWLLVVNKPAGVVVHPAPGHWRGTLVHGLLWRYPSFGPFNNVERPGIVHRLDATTSGLMVVARQQKAMELLQRRFRERTVEKDYLALAHGAFARTAGTLEGPIDRHPQNRLKMAVVEGGRPSTTGYRVLWTRENRSLVLCRLVTGRTHQIRVHMAACGHPLVGDVLYGAPELPGFGRVFLHSWRLSFTHPMKEAEPLTFRAPLPAELQTILRN